MDIFTFFYYVRNMEGKKQVIVVSLPGERDDQQYHDIHKHVANVFIEMDKCTEGLDHLFILHSKEGRQYLNRHEFKNAHLIEVDKYVDMWMRDFPPAMPKLQVQFKYDPGYITSSQAETDRAGFEQFAAQVRLPPITQCDVMLEGGNIVENGKDVAIITEKMFKQNKGVNKDVLLERIEAAIERKVMVIPDCPGHTTGHADGVACFVNEDTLLVAYYQDDKDYFDAIEREVKKVFPDIKIVALPCYQVNERFYGFSSAEGSYTNSLVTNNAVYLPLFSNHSSNEKALKVFKDNTNKKVVPVYGMEKVAPLGGSIRCMSWQIDEDHPIAKALFEYVEKGGDH